MHTSSRLGPNKIPSADMNLGNLDEYLGRHGNKFKRFFNLRAETSERSEEVLFLRGVIWDVERIRVPQIRGFPVNFGPKCWNILTKLGKKVDFSIAESVAWFIF